MSDEDDDENEKEGGGPGGASPELLKSYLAFAIRAVKARLFLTIGVALVGLVLSGLAAYYYPRSFNCTTVLMGQGNQVLEGWNASAPLFPGAAALITRNENLEAIIRETGLIKKFKERRPTILKLKDDLREKISGPMPDEYLVPSLVGTLRTKIGVSTDWNTLTINVEWTDGKTAAEIAAAAREGFIKNRHSAEMAAFEDKASILEGHSAKLREEIESLAGQIKKRKDEKLEQRRAATPTPAPATAASPAPAARVEVVRRSSPVNSERVKLAEQELETKKRKLSEFEGERDRRLREERAKIADLKLKLTPSHPDVVTAEQRLAILAQLPSDMMLLKSEIESLKNELSQLEALDKTGTVTRSVRPTGGAATQAEPLPSDIIGLLSEDEADPILVAQLSGAVSKYGALRDGLRSGRIELDTAQAAFNQRYKMIVPAEAPAKPSKPNVALIFGAGFAFALLLGLLLPVVLELRTGIIVERWQVEHVQLPVLAELRLPTRSTDS